MQLDRSRPHSHRPAVGLGAAVSACALATSLIAPPPLAAHTRITTDITWSGEIRDILRRHCMRCHSPGGIAPDYADFTTYGSDSKPGARAWATAIEEEILTGRMPPWDADPRYGDFGNARQLAEREIAMILAWVNGGAPQGPRRDLPPPAEFAEESWLLGSPDVVVGMPEPHTVPGGKMSDTRTVTVELDIGGPTWVTGLEFRSDRPQSVHRMTAWLHDTADTEPEALEVEIQVPYDPFRDEDEPEPTRMYELPVGKRFLGQWLRGDAPILFPEGAGKRLRPGSKIELFVEYRRRALEGNDRPLVDEPRLGLFLARAEDEVDLIAESQSFGGEVEIDKRALKGPLTSSLVLEENLRLVALNPRLGPALETLEVVAHYPDQRSKTLVYIPEYSADWPASFFFAEPLDAPQGTRVEMIATFANDALGSTQDFGAVIDYTLDDHLVLPELPTAPERSSGPRGGMLANIFGKGVASTGSEGATAPAPSNPLDPNAAAHMDHSPLHGGQFFMAPNMYHHLEGALPAPGEFYLYVYDDFKEPVDPRNFAGRVVFERYDAESGDFAEEDYPLAAVPGTDYLRASISDELPAEFFASVSLAGQQQRFDFYFEELSKEPPAARPSLTYADSEHSHERPPLTIPEDAADIVRALVERARQVEQKIAEGDWLKLYVPAFDGRDLAEALLEKLEGLSARDRGKVRKAASRVMQSSFALDRAGDLGDAARARAALDRFNSGVREMVEAVLEP